MGKGIIICGLNGVGKSTLGKKLAQRINFHFIDIEDLYFSKTDNEYQYDNLRKTEEVKELLMKEINTHSDFVLASVKGDFGADVCSFFNYAVIIEAPKEVRMQRVRSRAYQKFGNRIQRGGDLYEKEEAFFRFTEKRGEDIVQIWAESLECPVIKVDGTKSVDENIEIIMRQIC